jgi:hypothetical protein
VKSGVHAEYPRFDDAGKRTHAASSTTKYIFILLSLCSQATLTQVAHIVAREKMCCQEAALRDEAHHTNIDYCLIVRECQHLPRKRREGRALRGPVFYGAFSDDVCTAEVRPYVGGLVLVGEFRTTRRLRLLDLTRLDEAGFAGSMFDPDYDGRVMKRRFLRAFHYLISRPVQPHEEAIEYLPTQAVAEYISNVLELDGIIYESAQLGAPAGDDEGGGEPTDRTKQNVVPFNRAALVRGSRPNQTRS